MSPLNDTQFEFNAVSRLVFEHAAEPMVFLINGSTVQFTNTAMERLSGYNRGELIGRCVDSFVPSWSTLNSKYFRPGAVMRVESKLLKNSGRTIPVELRVAVAESVPDHPKLLTITDVRDKKQSKRRTSVKDRRNELFFATLCDPAFIWDRDGNIVDANPAAELLMRSTRETLCKRRIGALWAEESDWSDLLEYFHENGTVHDVTVSLTAKDGSPIDCVVSGSALTSRMGRPHHYALVLRDVTVQRQLERKLRQRQRSDDVGNLATGIANDLNNIISIQLGYAQRVLMKSEPDWVYRQDLQRVLEASERARDLVRQIGALHQPNEKKKGPVDLYVVLQGVLDVLRRCLPSNVEIRDRLDANAENVFGVPSELRRALLELCKNAGRSMQAGGGVLFIALESNQDDFEVDGEGRLCRDNQFVTVTIGAHSSCLNAREPYRIFEPPLTESNRMVSPHSIISGHEGVMVVDHVRNDGVRCHVRLPGRTKKELKVVSTQVPHARPGEQVLVVDDEILLLELYARALLDLGYSVDKAKSVDEALTLIGTQRKDYSLIVCDHAMPDFTGVDLANSLKHLGHAVPILMLTGNPDMVPKDKLPDSIVRLMYKPVNIDELARFIRQALD